MDVETKSLIAAALHAADQAGLAAPIGAACGICVSAPPPVFPAPVPSCMDLTPEEAAAILDHWPPLWLLGCLPNMAASHLAIQFQASGPCHTLATTNWETLTSLAGAWIESGEAGCVIVAGRTGDGRMRAAILQALRREVAAA